MSQASTASVNTKSTNKTGWKSSAQQELERVSLLLQNYEKANVELKDEIFRLNEVQGIHIKRLQDMDKGQKQLLKKIKSLEVSLKYEKVAGEGLRKRGNNFEASVVEYQEKATNAEKKVDYYQGKNEELEESLQHERSTRLQLLHEKNKLFQELKELKKKSNNQESELVNCHQRITDYIQRIETLTEQVSRQEQLLKYQSKEFVDVSRDIIRVKEDLLKAKEQLLSEYEEKHHFHFSVDLLQKEISYLRKELITHATNHSERSYTSFHHSHPNQFAITNQVNTYTAKRYDTSNFVENRTFTSKNNEASETDHFPTRQTNNHHRIAYEPSLSLSQSVVTPLNHEPSQLMPPSTASTDHSLRSHSESRLSTAQPSSRPTTNAVSRLTTADRPRGALDYLEVTNKDSINFNNKERMDMLEWIRNSGKELSKLKSDGSKQSKRDPLSPAIKSSIKNIQQSYGGKSIHGDDEDEEEELKDSKDSSFITRRDLERRSIFVGSGLGFRQDDKLDKKLKDLQAGSTKQMLRKILETID